MQNRYAGDVGDFIKLGLIRHLAAADLSFGVNWYLTPDEAHNADGKHVAYVEPGNRQHASLKACDPDLMERLSRVVAGSRSVQALEDSGALPASALTFGEVLDRSVDRKAWHERALAALVSADTVFVDPDNGLASASGRPTIKHVLTGELADYAARGQSLVVYHHADRSAKAEVQAKAQLGRIARAVGQVPVGAIIARRGSCRLFLVTASDERLNALADRLQSFAERWRGHVELVRVCGERA
jgi:hypothetical protein